MIVFTAKSPHITTMTKKPNSQGYMFFCMAEKGYVCKFQPSLYAFGVDPVDVESHLLKLIDTGKMIHKLIRHEYQTNRILFFNSEIDNIFTSQPPLPKLCNMRIVLGTLPGYPASVQIGTGTENQVRVRNCQGAWTALSSRGCYPHRTLNRGLWPRWNWTAVTTIRFLHRWL